MTFCKKLLLGLLFLIFIVPQSAYAQTVLTPTLFCLGSCPSTPTATAAPSAAPTSGQGGNPTVAPTAPSTTTSTAPSTAPSTPSAPSPSVSPCPSSTDSTTSIEAKHKKPKKHHAPMKNGFLQQFIQFLLQLLQQLFKLLGIPFPSIPGIGSGCPSTSPSPAPGGGGTPSSSPSTAPVTGTPSQGGTQPTAKPTSATGPTSAPVPTTPVTSSSCTNPSHVLAMDPSDPQAGITLDKYYLTNDNWNSAGFNITQTMSICNFNSWFVVAGNMSEDGGVKTYPNVHEDFNNVAISSFKTVSSTFASTSPRMGIYDAAYDIWINDQDTELMIWNDSFDQTLMGLDPGGSKQTTVTLGGITYDVYKDNGYIAFKATTAFDSGTVDLLGIFKWITSQGWIASNSTLSQIDYGIEFISTNNQNATFKVTNFSITTN